MQALSPTRERHATMHTTGSVHSLSTTKRIHACTCLTHTRSVNLSHSSFMDGCKTRHRQRQKALICSLEDQVSSTAHDAMA